jgi:hypothetical protein
MDQPVLEMYRDTVDPAARNDIAAAAAAHRELGRDYDGAVAEGLVDRIGAEIDKRIDARLGPYRPDPRSTLEASESGKSRAMWTGAGIGAGITGLLAMIANKGSESSAVIDAVIVAWIILAIAALGAAYMRKYYVSKYRGREQR